MAAADRPVPCRAGQKGAGCRQRIGTNQGCAGRAHLGDKAKRRRGNFYYVISFRFVRSEMNEGETEKS